MLNLCTCRTYSLSTGSTPKKKSCSPSVSLRSIATAASALFGVAYMEPNFFKDDAIRILIFCGGHGLTTVANFFQKPVDLTSLLFQEELSYVRHNLEYRSILGNPGLNTHIGKTESVEKKYFVLF